MLYFNIIILLTVPVWEMIWPIWYFFQYYLEQNKVLFQCSFYLQASSRNCENVWIKDVIDVIKNKYLRCIMEWFKSPILTFLLCNIFVHLDNYTWGSGMKLFPKNLISLNATYWKKWNETFKWGHLCAQELSSQHGVNRFLVF